jgi:hypothetical protein
MSDGAYRLDIKIAWSRIGHGARNTVRYIATLDNKIEVFALLSGTIGHNAVGNDRPEDGLGVKGSQVQILSSRPCDVSGHRSRPDLQFAGSAYFFVGPGGRPVGW